MRVALPSTPARPVDSRAWSFKWLTHESQEIHGSWNRRLCCSSDDTSLEAIQDDGNIPDSAKNAIIIGLKRYETGNYDEALKLFEDALELPGSGVKRFRNKPAEISTGERMAALYNIACCHSGKGDTRAGLVALAACLEAGYDDFKQLRTDPDLQQIREDPRFESLMQRFEPKAGLLGSIVKGFGG